MALRHQALVPSRAAVELAASALIAMVGLLLVSAAVNAQTISGANVSPTTVLVNVQTTVTFSIGITGPNVLPGGVNLVRLNANGTSTVVGQLRDDGQNGDADQADGVFSGRVLLNEPLMGSLRFQAAVAFKGVLQRTRVDFPLLFIQTADAPAKTLKTIAEQLDSLDVASAVKLFADGDLVARVLQQLGQEDVKSLSMAIRNASLVSASDDRRIYSVTCSLSSGDLAFNLTMAPNGDGAWIVIDF